MINNSAIEVAIGLFFIYALYSLLTTALTELIASWFNQRGKILKMGIKRMLDNDNPKESEKNLSSLFFDIPEIKYLGKGKNGKNTRFPAHLKPKTFVNSLLDTLKIEYPGSTDLATIKNSSDLASIKKSLDPDNETHKMLIKLIDRAENNVNQFKILVEEWFNETMDRVSGWYKRRLRLITLLVGALIAFSLNIDSIKIAKILSENDEARIAMVESASNYMTSINDTNIFLVDTTSLNAINEEVKTLILKTKEVKSFMKLPYPFSTKKIFAWLSYIFGCFITTIALSLGSPFWFDLLSKLIKLRSSGTQEKTTNTNSPPNQAVG